MNNVPVVPVPLRGKYITKGNTKSLYKSVKNILRTHKITPGGCALSKGKRFGRFVLTLHQNQRIN